MALADAITTIPTNPDFSSINIAQSVLLLGYDYYAAGADKSAPAFNERTRPATKDELLGMMDHWERVLDDAGFLRPPERKPSMVRNLRNLWQRADLREQDVRTLRGIIASLDPAKVRDGKND